MAELSKVTAADLMQSKVLTLAAQASIREAVETFEEYHIKGAPVIDAAGKLVGVLTASDIANSAHMERDRIVETSGDYYLTDPLDDLGGDGSARSEQFRGKDNYSPELYGDVVVQDWMTPRVISVTLDASLDTICKTMVRESIHRVIVLENNHIRGIVTTFDVVRYLAENPES